MARSFSGRLAQIGFGHQTAEGTTQTPTFFYKWLQGTAVDPTWKVDQEYEGDGTMDMSFINKSSSMWKGKLSWYMRPTDCGQIAAMICGTSAETLKTAPTGQSAAASGTGGTIPAGTYHYAIAFLYGSVEGPLSADLSVTVASGNDVVISTIPADSNATKIRVYKGVAGGSSGVYSLFADVAVATSITDTGSTPTFAAYPQTGVTTGNATTGTLHYFQPQTALDFWTCEFDQIIPGVSNQIRVQVADCFPTELTITGTPNKPVKADLAFVGKYATVLSSATSSSGLFDTATRPLIMANSTFTLDGVGSLLVTKFTLKYALTIDDTLLTASQVWPYTFAFEKRLVSVDYELLFTDASKYYNFLSGGVTSNPTGGTVIDDANIATGTLDLRFLGQGTDATNAFGLSVNNIAYGVKSPQLDLSGKPFRQPVTGFGLRSATLPLLSVQIRNGQATIY